MTRSTTTSAQRSECTPSSVVALRTSLRMPVNCGPRGLPPGYVQLFRNNGDGTFKDITTQSGTGAGGGRSFRAVQAHVPS